MSRTSKTVISPTELIHVLRDHRLRWIVPAVAMTFLAVVYALLRPAAWDATQALMVRDEAMGTAIRPGKFQQPDDMKTTQETILELARSRAVLSAALADVGPFKELASGATWPNDAAIASLQGRVKLVPPKGAEFGKTEVFYLNVEAESRDRAVALSAAICQHLQLRSQEIRDQKAQSLISELNKTADLSKADLAVTTTELTSIESKVGADLGELRLLTDSNGGDSQLRRSLNEMDQELRQARQGIDSNRELLSLLEASKTDARALAAAPNRLLEAQPILRRLKDGLVDAQLHTAQLSGNLTDNHPLVIAAKVAEQEISDHVRGEIDSCLVGAQAEMRLAQSRVDVLEEQLNDAHNRLEKLAEMRAGYANLSAERNQRADLLKAAEQQLAEARASQAAARTASLLTVIDAPVPSSGPIGPGKAAIVFGGLLGGLIIGFGVVFLTVNPAHLELPHATAAELSGNPVFSADSVIVQDDEEFIPDPVLTGGPSFYDYPVNGHHTNGYANEHINGSGKLSLKQALSKLALAR